jgi:hypothetical protein
LFAHLGGDFLLNLATCFHIAGVFDGFYLYEFSAWAMVDFCFCLTRICVAWEALVSFFHDNHCLSQSLDDVAFLWVRSRKVLFR